MKPAKSILALVLPAVVAAAGVAPAAEPQIEEKGDILLFSDG
ncbi:MAG: hypothetical protein ACYTG0_31025 [Planctomycetota bacterium]|jgi:hypothetical protein